VVGGLGMQGDEVPERVVSRLSLGDLDVGVRLGGVDQSGNLMPSWMKNTGMLFPTRSKVPSSV
jgi:hypothetical protein